MIASFDFQSKNWFIKEEMDFDSILLWASFIEYKAQNSMDIKSIHIQSL